MQNRAIPSCLLGTLVSSPPSALLCRCCLEIKKGHGAAATNPCNSEGLKGQIKGWRGERPHNSPSATTHLLINQEDWRPAPQATMSWQVIAIRYLGESGQIEPLAKDCCPAIRGVPAAYDRPEGAKASADETSEQPASDVSAFVLVEGPWATTTAAITVGSGICATIQYAILTESRVDLPRRVTGHMANLVSKNNMMRGLSMAGPMSGSLFESSSRAMGWIF